jgi:hypothetical protein
VVAIGPRSPVVIKDSMDSKRFWIDSDVVETNVRMHQSAIDLF